MVFGKWAKSSFIQRFAESFVFIVVPTLVLIAIPNVVEAWHSQGIEHISVNFFKTVYESNRASIDVALITTAVASLFISAAP